MIAKSPELPVKSQTMRHVDDYLEVGQKAGASDVHLAVNAQPIWRLVGRVGPVWPGDPPLKREQNPAPALGFLLHVAQKKLTTHAAAAFTRVNNDARSIT